VDWDGGSAGARRPELIDVCRPWRSRSGSGDGWDGPGGPKAARRQASWVRRLREKMEAARRGTEGTHTTRSAADGVARAGWRAASSGPPRRLEREQQLHGLSTILAQGG
jgi:hypothetical protein